MPKTTRWVVLAAVAAIVTVAPLSAQQRSTVSSTALDAAVAAPPANDRAVLSTALASPAAVATAGRLGVSPAQLAAHVAALDDASAQRLADRVRAGGDTLVIGTTTVIIVLLLILLLR